MDNVAFSVPVACFFLLLLLNAVGRPRFPSSFNRKKIPPLSVYLSTLTIYLSSVYKESPEVARAQFQFRGPPASSEGVRLYSSELNYRRSPDLRESEYKV